MVADLDALGGEVAAYADLLDDGEVVLAADRCRGVDEVGELGDERLRLGVGGVARGLGRLDPLGEAGRLGHEGVELGLDGRLLVVAGLLQPALQRTDALAELLLLVAQRAVGHLGGATRLVGGHQPVDDRLVLATGALRRTNSVRVLAHNLEIDHGPSLVRTASTIQRAPIPGNIHVTAGMHGFYALNDAFGQ